eukprot:2469128-Rhodomonas_salina.2
MHASMLSFLLAETKREIATIQTSPAFAARAAADPYGHAAELVAGVQAECEDAAAQQQAARPAIFNDDHSFRRCVMPIPVLNRTASTCIVRSAQVSTSLALMCCSGGGADPACPALRARRALCACVEG